MAVKPAAPATKDKKFSQLVILSPGAELSAAEAELRLYTTARYLNVAQEKMPPVTRVSAIAPTADATALALYRAFRAVGRGGPALYLSGGNPAAGALSILVTDWGNTFLAPNDGSLGLLSRLFALREINHTLATLDTEKVLEAEQTRMQNPEWQPAADFPLRDILAPAAAALLAGVGAPKLSLPLPTATTHGAYTGGIQVKTTPFSATLGSLSLKLGSPLPVQAMPLNEGPRGHGQRRYLLNLALDPLAFEQLLDDKAQFTLSAPGGLFGAKKFGLTPEIALPGSVASSHKLVLSPYAAPQWDERFLGLHLVSSHEPLPADPLTLLRTR